MIVPRRALSAKKVSQEKFLTIVPVRIMGSDKRQQPLGVATINQCIHEAGRAVEPIVQDELVPAVREAKLLHADETGWKQWGQPLWLWVITCATATLFVVGQRTREVVERILGESFGAG